MNHPECTCKVPAEVHSDDREVMIAFDAEPYLAQASDHEIEALVGCGWGGDYPADSVAEFFDLTPEGEDGPTREVFAYLHSNKDRLIPIDLHGFECRIVLEAGEQWLRTNRPQLALRLLPY